MQILFTEMSLINFVFNMIWLTYGKSKDIVERTQSEKVLRDKAFMQVLMFYCNYVGGTFCDTYVGGSFC